MNWQQVAFPVGAAFLKFVQKPLARHQAMTSIERLPPSLLPKPSSPPPIEPSGTVCGSHLHFEALNPRLPLYMQRPPSTCRIRSQQNCKQGHKRVWGTNLQVHASNEIGLVAGKVTARVRYVAGRRTASKRHGRHERRAVLFSIRLTQERGGAKAQASEVSHMSNS